MSPKESASREAVIAFMMKQVGFSRQEAIENIKELEIFGLISFNSKGDFRMREV